VREANEDSEEISAAGAENTQSFSAVEFHEPGAPEFHVLISLDYPSRRQEARLLLCPCAGTENRATAISSKAVEHCRE
jgi:hypothetical protein